jgi:hypothetical protein
MLDFSQRPRPRAHSVAAIPSSIASVELAEENRSRKATRARGSQLWLLDFFAGVVGLYVELLRVRGGPFVFDALLEVLDAFAEPLADVGQPPRSKKEKGDERNEKQLAATDPSHE